LNSSDASRYLSTRGAPAGLRFVIYAVLALALMYLDQRGRWLESIRYGLQAIAYPIEIALNSPAAAWQWSQEIFEDRAALQAENRQLRQRLRELEQLALRRESLERENAALRAIATPAVDVVERYLPAQIIGSELNSQQQRLTLDRGAINGVFDRQAVVAAGGVLGQTMRVGPWSSEIILVTDSEHALPVQILRTGVRTLAIGTGRREQLSVPFLPLQTDIRRGDRLITSGLGGVFPAGYPVAVVTDVKRDGGAPLAQVQARTLARVDRDRIVSLLWFTPTHPAAPVSPAQNSGGDPAARAIEVTPSSTTPPSAAPPSATPQGETT
jgi:rod shape-determining protein MreC